MPDTTMLIAKPKDILLLAKGLLQDAKKIEELNAQLTKNLQDVAKVWSDDSFTEMHTYVSKAASEMATHKESIAFVAASLVKYAEKLRPTL